MPDDDDRGRWLPLKTAAPRLSLERDTLRKQLARGERQGRRDNRGRWLTLVPDDAGTPAGAAPGNVSEPSRTDASTATADAGVTT